jgi:hypothetical protein
MVNTKMILGLISLEFVIPKMNYTDLTMCSIFDNKRSEKFNTNLELLMA